MFRPGGVLSFLPGLLGAEVVAADQAADDFSLGVGLWRKKRWVPAAETFEQFLIRVLDALHKQAKPKPPRGN